MKSNDCHKVTVAKEKENGDQESDNPTPNNVSKHYSNYTIT